MAENVITKEAYKGDIVFRLRNWRGLHLAHGGDLCEEAAAEIASLRADNEKLRGIIRIQDAAIRSDTITLTDAEREAVGRAEFVCAGAGLEKSAATLRGLLERTK